MCLRSYVFTVPDRGILCVAAVIPAFISLNHYFVRRSITTEELATTLILFVLVFLIAMYYASRRYPLVLMMDRLETRRRQYRPGEIKSIKIYRRSGLLTVKLAGSLDSRRFKFNRRCLPEAVDEMVHWARCNEVNYSVYK